MTNQTFEKIVRDQLETCEKLLTVKGEEYAPCKDRLQAFKKAAALQGETTAQALCGMLAKHVVSIYDMCMSGSKFTMDKWSEKITDSINYLLILAAVIKEENHATDLER